MDALRIKNLSFAYEYGFLNALTNIDLTLKEGEFVVFMGRSGAGKSTLCQTLTTLIPNFYPGALEGAIEVLGEPIIEKRVYEMAKKVGMVFQDYEAQLFSTNAELECAFGPENIACPKEEIRGRIKDSLLKLGLMGFEKRSPFSLSDGEKQRLTIASILSMKPKILILDEPSTDLDPQGRTEIIAVCELLREEGVTIILIENDAQELLSADRVVLLDEGEIVADGKPGEILRKVRLLERCGVKPPQMAKLFQQIDYHKRLPLTTIEAIQIFQDEGYQLSENRYNVLKYQDEQRMERYEGVLIEVKGLQYGYDKRDLVLDGINLEIRKGEFIALIGQNGCGKTTLLKHLNGLLKPLRGEVIYLGKSTRDFKVSTLARRIGYIFQNPDHQLFANTIFEEVSFGPRNLGIPEEEISRRVAEALKAVDLEVYGKDDPFLLTKGGRQKLACASILASAPQIILLDEPTTGLDYREILHLMKLLQELNKKGHTIIMATQAMWLAAEYSHRTIVLSEGRIILDASTRRVFSDREILKEAHLLAPQAVNFSQPFGFTLLSNEEVRFCLSK